MQIIEIQSRKDWKLFHRVPHRVYRDDPNWICPLERDIEAVLSPTTNKFFAHGAGRCYVLLDEENRPAGRIAAFIDFELEKKVGYRAGGVGFFECLENQPYASALFDKAREFLSSYNVQVIDGPINFGERDKFWGLLVKGFAPPLYQENYHPPYYQALFENWGFRPYEQIVTFRGKIDEVPMPRFRAIAERARRRHPFTVVHPDFTRIEKYARDFVDIYNASFEHSPYFKPMESQAFIRVFKSVRLILDPMTISYAYHEDRPVGFCILFPEVNPFFKKFKGKINLLNGLRFLYNLRRSRQKDLKGMAFGIHPDFHRKGVYSLLVQKIYDSPGFVQKYQYYNLATIRTFNEIMVKSTSNLGGKIDRIHYTYRKVIDPDFTFEPLAFMDESEL